MTIKVVLAATRQGIDNVSILEWSPNSDGVLVAGTVSWLHGICFEVILIDVL